MENSHCYHFEKRIYNRDGFFDSFVNATYILTLTTSKRKEQWEDQLRNFTPTKIVYIVYNQGFKKCKKNLPMQIPPYDLMDSNIQVMNHAVQNRYSNILVLEDDFIFDEKVKSQKVAEDIRAVFDRNKNKKFYYNLGVIPIIIYPSLYIQNNTLRGLLTTAAHANLYPIEICQDILKNKKYLNYIQWDSFLLIYKKYFYRTPLCYQIFPETENKKYWSINKDGKTNIILYVIVYCTDIFHKILNLDKRPQPGFNIIYNTVIIGQYLLVYIIILIIVYYVFKRIISNV